MNIFRIVSFVLVFPLCFTTGCGVGADPSAERAALLETDRAWAAAAASSAGVDEIASYWAADAVVIPPGAPALRGLAEIRDYISAAASIPGFSVSWTPEGAELAASGDVGDTYGTNRFTFENGAGLLTTATGRYLTTWRKQPDGSWKCRPLTLKTGGYHAAAMPPHCINANAHPLIASGRPA
jgi:ketosteroid isomerase-like protein